MDNFLEGIARLLKTIHDFIVKISNHMDDKALHFLVLGLAGMIIFGITYPMFKRFDKKNKPIAMTAVYTGTVATILAIAMASVQEVNVNGVGLLLVFALIVSVISYRIFKYLDLRNKAFRITNFFTVTMIVIFAIAIELCQGLTKTGSMEIADALFGIAGYVVMYLVMFVITTIIKHILRMKRNSKAKKDH